MNTDRLTEALIELRHQRTLIESAITTIENVLRTLDDSSRSTNRSASQKKQEESYIDLGVRVLEEAGKEMHIAEIAKKISVIKGRPVPRASVESSFIRHIATFGKKARVAKVRPAHFTVPSLMHAVSSSSGTINFESLAKAAAG